MSHSQDLASQLSQMQKQAETLETHIQHHKNELSADQKKLESLNKAIFETKKHQKEHDLALLDAKTLDLAQNIEQREEEVNQIRDKFANWQKELEKRDSNLRIREAKVKMGEDKLLTNSDLLNL